jgi:LacI family transcriptional regulator
MPRGRGHETGAIEPPGNYFAGFGGGWAILAKPMPKSRRLQRKNSPPTLAQIAAEASVSISAASRILGGKRAGSFNAQTVSRVKAAAERLRYRPNRLVRGIQTGRSGLVGVLMPAHDGFYSMVMAGIHDALVAKDCLPVVLWSDTDGIGQLGRTELEQIHALVDLRVEGVILKPVFDAASDEYLHEILERKIPLVVVDRALPRAHVSFVGSDDEAGVISALDYLKSQGHREFVYFGPETVISTGQHRLQSFRAYIEHDNELRGHEFMSGGWTPSLKEAEDCLRAAPHATAVLGGSDEFARMILEAARGLGRRVPQDLSVVGHGNLPSARHLFPPLTTLDQHPHSIGMTAARTLISQIEQPGQPHCKILMPPHLVVRESSGPAPTAAAAPPLRPLTGRL